MIDPHVNGYGDSEPVNPPESEGHGAEAREAVERRMALRTAVQSELKVEDVRAIVRRLVDLAKEGNVPAAKEVLDRSIGLAESPALARYAEASDAMMRRLENGPSG